MCTYLAISVAVTLKFTQTLGELVGKWWENLEQEESAQGYVRSLGLPRWFSGKEFACQCRRRGFNPWVGTIPWRRKWQLTPVFLLPLPWAEEPAGLQSLELQRVRHDSTHTHTRARAHTHTHTHTHAHAQKILKGNSWHFFLYMVLCNC